MCDIFDKEQVLSLFKCKHVVFIGDSNIRAQYKDLIWLLNSNSIIQPNVLKRKLEMSFLGDKLIKRSELHRGRNFEEVRSYESVKQGIKIDYMFITNCYNKNIVQYFTKFKNKKSSAPGVVFMNSCLWDLTRWGPDGANLYKQNMKKLMTLFKECLPVTTLVIWSTALPVASQIRCGLLIKQIEFLKHTLRFDVNEANHFARNIVVNHGYDVLDIHYFMRYQIHRRGNDGVHYTPVAVRYMTNMILTHIAVSWGYPLPGRIKNVMEKIHNSECVTTSDTTDTRLPLLENVAQNTNKGLRITTDNKSDKRTVHKISDEVLKGVSGSQRFKRKFRLNRNNPYKSININKFK